MLNSYYFISIQYHYDPIYFTPAFLLQSISCVCAWWNDNWGSQHCSGHHSTRISISTDVTGCRTYATMGYVLLIAHNIVAFGVYWLSWQRARTSEEDDEDKDEDHIWYLSVRVTQEDHTTKGRPSAQPWWTLSKEAEGTISHVRDEAEVRQRSCPSCGWRCSY